MPDFFRHLLRVFPKLTLKGGVMGKVAAVTISYFVCLALFAWISAGNLAVLLVLVIPATLVAGMVGWKMLCFADKHVVESIMDGAEFNRQTQIVMGSKGKPMINVSPENSKAGHQVQLNEGEEIPGDEDTPKLGA